MPRREGHSKVCRFCQDKVVRIDYKDEKRLSRYISEHAHGEGAGSEVLVNALNAMPAVAA